jgi:hypothetical protein
VLHAYEASFAKIDDRAVGRIEAKVHRTETGCSFTVTPTDGCQLFHIGSEASMNLVDLFSL